MENFVVSARKYRPTGFDEVVGQEHITTTLKNAIDNLLKNALEALSDPAQRPKVAEREST